MVCIEKRPYTLYGRLATLHFRYLTCLLDRGHIKCQECFSYRLIQTSLTPNSAGKQKGSETEQLFCLTPTSFKYWTP